MWVEDWTPAAACRQAQPDQLFVRGAEQNKAKQLCAGCPVRTECLAEALDNQIEWGVWGGMTERERRALLRRRPAAPKGCHAGTGGARQNSAPCAPATGAALLRTPDRRRSRCPLKFGNLTPTATL